MSAIRENLARIRERIAAAARRAGRSPDDITLVAVSKKMSVERILEAVEAGQRVFGENYLQEAREKIGRLDPALRWHFIGHLQSNKAKAAADLFQVIETVDGPKLAANLEKRLALLERKLAVFLQVNIGREPQKAGLLPEDAAGLLRMVSECPHLEVKGLMAIPPHGPDPEASRPYFRKMRVLAGNWIRQGLLPETAVDLSMGMSTDFEVAVEEGATVVRVGTALFGPRPV